MRSHVSCLTPYTPSIRSVGNVENATLEFFDYIDWLLSLCICNSICLWITHYYGRQKSYYSIWILLYSRGN